MALLGATADIEHRAVQPHLDAAWTLLWAASGARSVGKWLPHSPTQKPRLPWSACCEGGGRERRDPLIYTGSPQFRRRGTQYRNAAVPTPYDDTPGATGTAAGGLETAGEVAAKLVRAYAELRQLDYLLASLTAALMDAGPGGAAVVQSDAFQVALRKAVRELPSGQAAPLVRFVAASAGGLAAMDAVPLAAMADVLLVCLESLRVDTTTAAAVATAAQELAQQALAADLLVALGSRGSCLGPLLQLYLATLRLHQRCSGLEPQVLTLPGQDCESAHAEGGFFESLVAGTTAPRLADLMPLLEDGLDCPPNTRTAVAACAAHRLGILRERQLRARFGCPLLTLNDDVVAEEGHDTTSMEPLIEQIQTGIRSLAVPLVRSAIAAVSQLTSPSAAETARAGHSHTASNVALWEPVCGTVDKWAGCVDDVQRRGFLQVSIVATCDGTAKPPRVSCGSSPHLDQGMFCTLRPSICALWCVAHVETFYSG